MGSEGRGLFLAVPIGPKLMLPGWTYPFGCGAFVNRTVADAAHRRTCSKFARPRRLARTSTWFAKLWLPVRSRAFPPPP